MAGLVGKGQRSYRKASVGDSNLPALGFKRFLFAFQNGATPVAAGTAITFASVIGNVPSEMTGNGFSQPTLAEVRNAEFGSFRDNVVVTSNLNGVLQDYITYSITDDQITFLSSYSVDASEIITISRGQEPVTGNRIVNAKPLRQSGDVDFSGIGSAVVDFSVPEGFRIAPSVVTGGVDSRQIGYVQVFVDGVLQFRNAGNGDEDATAASAQTGNYREIFIDAAGTVTSTTGGVANTIRFNMGQPFSSTEGVLVISTNLIVDAPNNTSVSDQITAVSNNLNTLIGTSGSIDNITDVETTGATADQVLTFNGTQWAAAAGSSGGGGIAAISVLFNAGTHTVPVPSNFSDIVGLRIRAAGGGSSGGGGGTGNNLSTAQGGYGGEAGQFQERYINVGNGAFDISPTATSLTVVIGTGGAAKAGQPQSSNSTQGPNDSNPGVATTLTGPRGSDQVSTTLQTWAGGTINKYIGTCSYLNEGQQQTGTPSGLNQTNNGANGGDTAYGRGGRGGHGNNGGNDSLGGGGGGGAGWFDGSDGESDSSTGNPGGDGGAGGGGGMVVEWLTIQISQIG